VGLGAKYLYEEVQPGVGWDHPDNRLIWTTGPLAGTDVAGAATFNVTAKGPLTELAGATQANGFFGAYLKFCGYDGIIFQGRAPRLVYLLLKPGMVEVRDAGHLAGLDITALEDRLRQDLGVKEHDVSVFGIGPAGESKVRYAAIGGDRQHMAAHNGLGAVMGAKNIKAVVAFGGKAGFGLQDQPALKEAAKELVEFVKTFGQIYQWGTGGGFSALYGAGALPVRNYTTNLFPEHERMNGQYLRTHFEIKPRPCYRCAIAHVKEVKVTEGPYAGFVGEEPEYEQLAAWGPQIGNTDLGATVVLSAEVDRLGLDCNEASWTIGWAMECFQKGVFTTTETDGLDLSWGHVEAVRALLGRIARREGAFADMLAEGVMRASRRVGGPAAEWAIYAQKGVSPRSHDHRGAGRWYELFDSCVSNTGTIEATWGGVHPQLVDLEPLQDAFAHLDVAAFNANYSGVRLFDDCLGTCRLASPAPKLVLKCFNAATGFDFSLADAFTVGRRIINLLRVFNLKHGYRAEDERPSRRYASPPLDGPAKGQDIMAKWPEMLAKYRQLMGWDIHTGRPLDQTLEALGLADLVK
jgi:aldehyde:ferredoxin oxidoreductase